jgi:hypothetical protein
VAEVVSGGLCGIVKMETFPTYFIFNMDETHFTGSGRVMFRPSSGIREVCQNS